MRNPHKALEAIERLVGGSFGMDMECFLAGMSKIPDKELRKNLKWAAEIITKIYCISHAENSRGCSHPNWEKIKFEILAREEE